MKNGRYLIKNLMKKRMKKKNGNYLFPIILMIGMSFIMGFYYDGGVIAKLEDVTVELGDTLPVEVTNYVSIMPNQINYAYEDNVPKDTLGHTNKIGEYNYFLVYNDERNKSSKLTNIKASIKVIDTVKPVITLKDNKKFEYNSKITVSDIAECFDLSECNMYLENEIDSSISGEQEVKIIAYDEAMNKSSITTTITINEKPKAVLVSYNSSFDSMNYQNNLLNSTLTSEEKENLRYQIIEFAKQFIGNPYVYGGTSLTNGADCSGFTMSIYNNFGYSLPRVALSQDYIGIPVSEGNLLPGDIVVYHYDGGGGHVGIYAGNGMMIHAGTSQTGIVMAPMFSGYRTYRRIIY